MIHGYSMKNQTTWSIGDGTLTQLVSIYSPRVMDCGLLLHFINHTDSPNYVYDKKASRLRVWNMAPQGS